MSVLTLTEARDGAGERQLMDRLLRSGKVLAIDPASGGSSQPGFAISVEGRFVQSGVIKLSKGGLITHRLHTLLCALQNLWEHHGGFDLLVLEDIAPAFGGGHRGKQKAGGGGMITRGIVHLHWSCGVTMGACPWPHVLKVMPQSWHAWVRRQGIDDTIYKKSDEADATSILVTSFHSLTGNLPVGFDFQMLKE